MVGLLAVAAVWRRRWTWLLTLPALVFPVVMLSALLVPFAYFFLTRVPAALMHTIGNKRYDDPAYVVLDLEAVKKGITVTDEALKSYYTQNEQRFTTPEERRAIFQSKWSKGAFRFGNESFNDLAINLPGKMLDPALRDKSAEELAKIDDSKKDDDSEDGFPEERKE